MEEVREETREDAQCRVQGPKSSLVFHEPAQNDATYFERRYGVLDIVVNVEFVEPISYNELQWTANQPPGPKLCRAGSKRRIAECRPMARIGVEVGQRSPSQ